MTNTSEPVNDLEKVIRDGMNGSASADDLVAELLRSKVCIPSAREVQDDGTGLVPLLLQSPRFHAQMIVAFSDLSRIGPEETERAPYVLQVSGAWVVKSIAPDLGLILFAGPGAGCELSPQQLANIRQSMPV